MGDSVKADLVKTQMCLADDNNCASEIVCAVCDKLNEDLNEDFNCC